MTTLAELVQPLSTDECKALIYTALANKGITTTSWKPGAPTRTLIAGIAIVLSAFSILIALLAAAGFLDTAEGAWLTLKAKYDYSVEKDEGSFATGYVKLTNTAGGVYVVDPDDLIVSNPDTGKEYRNIEAFSLAAFGEVTVAIRATELGADSTSEAGAIVTMVTPLDGVTCTNEAAVVGADAETDESLREKCRESTGALSPDGPGDAYRYVARTVTRADGTNVGVSRVAVIPDGYGGVDVYVATASGGVTGTVGDLATDLGLVAWAIKKWVVPTGITARVHSATAKTINVTYELWLREGLGLTEAQAKERVAASVRRVLSSIDVGGDVIASAAGKVYKSAIEAAIAEAFPTERFGAAVVKRAVLLPTGDVTIDADEAPVAGNVLATVHFVPRKDPT